MVNRSQSLRRNLLSSQTREVELQRRCDRNRKRSQRRAIYCPIHGCHLHSVSQKYSLYADQIEQLQQRGVGRRQAMLSIANRAAVPLEGEWIEAFWCDQCQAREWFHVRKTDRVYEVSIAPPELWQQATGVIDPHRNPSVGEFTQRHARSRGYLGVKEFGFIQ